MTAPNADAVDGLPDAHELARRLIVLADRDEPNPPDPLNINRQAAATITAQAATIKQRDRDYNALHGYFKTYEAVITAKNARIAELEQRVATLSRCPS